MTHAIGHSDFGSSSWFLPKIKKRVVNQVERLDWFAQTHIELDASRDKAEYGFRTWHRGKEPRKDVFFNIHPLLFVSPKEAQPQNGWNDEILTLCKVFWRRPEVLPRVRDLFVEHKLKALKDDVSKKILDGYVSQSFSLYKDEGVEKPITFLDIFGNHILLSIITIPFFITGLSTALPLSIFIACAHLGYLWYDLSNRVNAVYEKAEKVFQADRKLLELTNDIEAIELLFEGYNEIQKKKLSTIQKWVQRQFQFYKDPRFRIERLKAYAKVKNIRYVNPSWAPSIFSYKKEACLIGAGILITALFLADFTPSLFQWLNPVENTKKAFANFREYVNPPHPGEQFAECISRLPYPHTAKGAKNIFNCNKVFRADFKGGDFYCKVCKVVKQAYKTMDQAIPRDRTKAFIQLDAAYDTLRRKFCVVKDTVQDCLSYCMPQNEEEYRKMFQCFPSFSKEFSEKDSTEKFCKVLRFFYRDYDQNSLLWKAKHVLKTSYTKLIEKTCKVAQITAWRLEDCVMKSEMLDVLRCHAPFKEKFRFLIPKEETCKIIKKTAREMSRLLHPDKLEGFEAPFKKVSSLVTDLKNFYC